MFSPRVRSRAEDGPICLYHVRPWKFSTTHSFMVLKWERSHQQKAFLETNKNTQGTSRWLMLMMSVITHTHTHTWRGAGGMLLGWLTLACLFKWAPIMVRLLQPLVNPHCVKQPRGWSSSALISLLLPTLVHAATIICVMHACASYKPARKVAATVWRALQNSSSLTSLLIAARLETTTALTPSTLSPRRPTWGYSQHLLLYSFYTPSIAYCVLWIPIWLLGTETTSTGVKVF